MPLRSRLIFVASAASMVLASRPAALAGSYAYITDYSHAVTVLDLATNEVRGKVEIGPYAPRGIAVDRRGRRVYVANNCGTVNCDDYSESASVSVIDPASLSVVATIPVAREPDHIVLNRAGTRLYVTNAFANVAVVDTVSARVIGDLPMRAGPLAISRNGARLYVGGGNLRVVDLATSTVVREDPRDRAVDALALGRSGRHVFVASCGRQCGSSEAGVLSVDVMDAETLAVLATIPIADDVTPGGLVADRAGRRLYLSGNGLVPDSSMVWAIDIKRAVVTAAIPVHTHAFDLALHPHAPRLYATAFFHDALTVIDTHSDTVMAEPGEIYSFRLAIGRAPRPATR